MFLPVKSKPRLDPFYEKSIIQVPNAISYETAMSIRQYALDKQLSGLHKRKDNGSFSTCLIHDLNDPIYQTLDKLWEQYSDRLNQNIKFIEPYEIKCYDNNDSFNYHIDNFSYVNQNDRQVSMSIQLSDTNEYEGGDLLIENVTCSRSLGTALFFPAGYWHCVTPITKGTRFALITWAWGPSATWGLSTS